MNSVERFEQVQRRVIDFVQRYARQQGFSDDDVERLAYPTVYLCDVEFVEADLHEVLRRINTHYGMGVTLQSLAEAVGSYMEPSPDRTIEPIPCELPEGDDVGRHEWFKRDLNRYFEGKRAFPAPSPRILAYYLWRRLEERRVQLSLFEGV